MAEETGPVDYTKYANQAPTPLQSDFAGWLPEKTGYDPTSAKSKLEAFNAGVRLAVSLRIPFQASPENRAATAKRQADRDASRVAAEAAKAEAAKAQPAPTEKAPAKATKAAATKATPEAAPPAAESAPASGRRRGARRANPAATATAAF